MFKRNIHQFHDFKTANHRLSLKTGRWCGTSNLAFSVADENHYIFECKVFENSGKMSVKLYSNIKLLNFVRTS